MKTVTIKYSCPLCGLVDIDVTIPARFEEDDVVVWMKDVGVYLSEDHSLRSPECHPAALKDIKIPIGDAKWIGGPVP
jgi:hypothetical protein